MTAPDDEFAAVVRGAGRPDALAAWINVLIPWAVHPRHDHGYHVTMLRLEARERAGRPIGGIAWKQLTAWKERLERDQLVVDYDPDSIEGWRLTHRRTPFDHDLIREPGAAE